MAGIDPSEVVNKLEDTTFLAKLIDRAGTGIDLGLTNKTKVASQVYVGLCLRTSIIELATALQHSAEAANRHARQLTLATAGLVLATLALVAATLVPAFIG